MGHMTGHNTPRIEAHIASTPYSCLISTEKTFIILHVYMFVSLILNYP